MAIRLGINPIGWSNDDLIEIGGATPRETCLAEAREAGITGMELGNKFPREPAALKSALAPYGMACIGGWYSIELLQRSRLTNNYWLGELSGAQDDPRRLTAIRETIPGTERVTAADVKLAAEAWLKPETAYKVVALPGATAAAAP